MSIRPLPKPKADRDLAKQLNELRAMCDWEMEKRVMAEKANKQLMGLVESLTQRLDALSCDLVNGDGEVEKGVYSPAGRLIPYSELFVMLHALRLDPRMDHFAPGQKIDIALFICDLLNLGDANE